MDARLNFYGNSVAAKFAKHINSAGKVVSESTLPSATQELVKIRASQINGCGFCTDMHTKDATHAGETSVLDRDGAEPVLLKTQLRAGVRFAFTDGVFAG